MDEVRLLERANLSLRHAVWLTGGIKSGQQQQRNATSAHEPVPWFSTLYHLACPRTLYLVLRIEAASAGAAAPPENRRAETGMEALLALLALAAGDPLDACNLVWTTPSADSAGSMPLGNGDIGLNAWVEPSGDLLFYLAKTDAWSENVRLLKLGRVRLRLDPPLRTDAFRQELRLREGCLTIGGGGAELRLWVSADAPVVCLEVTAAAPVRPTVELEVWRTAPRAIEGRERFSAYGLSDSPEPVICEPDTILDRDGELVWYHRNERSIWPQVLRHQGLGELIPGFTDPLLHRTFGGRIRGDGLRRESPTRLLGAEPRRRWRIEIDLLTAQTDTAEAFLERLTAPRPSPRFEAHADWWHRFWARSYIHVTADRVPSAPASRRMTVTAGPLHLGADNRGDNRFRGVMRRARVWSRGLSPEEVAGEPPADGLLADWDLAAGADGLTVVGDLGFGADGARFGGEGYLRAPANPRFNLTEAVTLEVEIRAEAQPPGGGRLIDKAEAGTANGYLLDTYPGNSLRLITAWNVLTSRDALPVGRWVRVTATVDAAAGRQALYLDGRPIATYGGGAGGDVGATITQGYALQRYINACAGRGAMPIKFNGSLFTVDAVDGDEHYDADYRRWGGPYWFQNTRLPYWSMLAAGDLDLMTPLFAMYRDALPLAREKTRLYWGHAGASFVETIYFFGLPTIDNYGWDRAGKPVDQVDNPYIRWYYDGALELCRLGLERYALGGDEAWLRETLLPILRETLTFYDLHYRRVDGKLRIEPGQALETWQQCVDPLPPIAGLRAVIDAALRLPARLIADDREAWRRLRTELPDLPVRTDGEAAWLLPAARYDALRNIENPELYAVFPYRLVAVGRGNLALGRETFARRLQKKTGGWHQDAIQAAYLGLTESAAADVHANFATHHAGSRFPAFWGPNYDWIPDQDHGCVAMTALQSMLLQWDEQKLYLLPAWPREWDVSFRLHAPGGTVVEGEFRDGRVTLLEVSPAARRADLVLPE